MRHRRTSTRRTHCFPDPVLEKASHATREDRLSITLPILALPDFRSRFFVQRQKVPGERSFFLFFFDARRSLPPPAARGSTVLDPADEDTSEPCQTPGSEPNPVRGFA